MKLDICEIKKMLKTMCEVTVYSERNQIYLKKHLENNWEAIQKYQLIGKTRKK